MANHNHVELIGRLAENPKVSIGKSNQTMASIIIMVNEYRRKSDGEVVKYVDSFKVKLYGQPASFAAGSLWSGSLVFVSGKLRNERWTDKAGETRYSVVIVVDESSGLQGLARPGHKASEEEEESEGEGRSEARRNHQPKQQERPAEASGVPAPTVDAASPEFEEAHGIQPIPF